MEKFSKIVLNVPHASTARAFDDWSGAFYMAPTVNKWTDWFTDLLFNSDDVDMVRFPYSRFFCDVERLVDDPLEDKGQGIVYTNFNEFEKDLTPEVKEEAMMMYHQYIEKVSGEIEDGTLLIDCHSFPASLVYGREPVDICIGYNEDWSKPERETIDFICGFLTAAGYKVKENYPYSNSLTPLDKDYCHYKSIMIEVNKKVYMDEESIILKRADAIRLSNVLSNLYLSLLDKHK